MHKSAALDGRVVGQGRAVTTLLPGIVVVRVTPNIRTTTQREIGKRFNISNTAVSQSVRRFEARLVKDQTLKQTVEGFLRGMSNVNN